jgi:hypothetical protein
MERLVTKIEEDFAAQQEKNEEIARLTKDFLDSDRQTVNSEYAKELHDKVTNTIAEAWKQYQDTDDLYSRAGDENNDAIQHVLEYKLDQQVENLRELTEYSQQIQDVVTILFG